ncbi:unnamed protein product [Calypogeia fissa]
MTTSVGFRSLTNPTNMNLMAVLVVLLTLQTPMLALARFKVWRPSEHVTVRGKFLEEGFAVDLLQYHHIDSPYATPNLTLAQRVEIAVKSSQERTQFFHKQIYGDSSSERFSDLAFSSPVFSAQGSYIMQLNLGTPARTFSAIADTGSDLIWVQCYPCMQCFQGPDSVFMPSASSSYRARSCTNDALCDALPPVISPCSTQQTCLYQYAYGDQSSTQGDLASETVTLTSTTGTSLSFPNVAFGCGHRNQGTFQSADGLVGLGQGPLSLVSQLGSNIGNVFSYCLVDFYSATTRTSPLLLGSTGGTGMMYTPLITNDFNPTFYYVTVTGITVGGIALSYPSAAFDIDATGAGGMILDSGTTVTQMDSRAYTPFVNCIASLVTYPQVDLYKSTGFDLCYDLSGVSNPTFPAVVFHFTDINLSLPGNNIFLQVDNIPNYCLAFQGSNLGVSIFGNIQQQNFQITYNRSTKQVGFAPKTC